MRLEWRDWQRIRKKNSPEHEAYHRLSGGADLRGASQRQSAQRVLLLQVDVRHGHGGCNTNAMPTTMMMSFCYRSNPPKWTTDAQGDETSADVSLRLMNLLPNAASAAPRKSAVSLAWEPCQPKWRRATHMWSGWDKGGEWIVVNKNNNKQLGPKYMPSQKTTRTRRKP